VFGEIHPAKPTRPVLVGVSIFVESGPMKAGSKFTSGGLG